MNRTTESFRKEHAEIIAHLSDLFGALDDLSSLPRSEQQERMVKIIHFLRDHLLPHARWEEKVLYPAVDQQAGHRITESMRYEHRIVERWMDDLKREASADLPDPRSFVRRADKLLGLVIAHFEEEEEVLLPILDRSMTKAEFDRRIGSKHSQ